MACRRHGTRLGWSARGLVVVMMVLARTGDQLRDAPVRAHVPGAGSEPAPARARRGAHRQRGARRWAPGRRSHGQRQWGLHVDTFVRPGPGRFAFAVTPGRYNLSAYEDRNKSGSYRSRRAHVARARRTSARCGPRSGEEARHRSRLPCDGSPRRGTDRGVHLVAEAPREEVAFSPWARSAQGTVCPDLRDERFGPEAAQRGVWRPIEFLHEGLAGVYFLDPTTRTASRCSSSTASVAHRGTSRPSLRSLDAERFQPWFYFYPSGAPLDGVSEHLARLLTQLEVTHGFESSRSWGTASADSFARGANLKHQPMDGVSRSAVHHARDALGWHRAGEPPADPTDARPGGHGSVERLLASAVPYR